MCQIQGWVAWKVTQEVKIKSVGTLPYLPYAVGICKRNVIRMSSSYWFNSIISSAFLANPLEQRIEQLGGSYGLSTQYLLFLVLFFLLRFLKNQGSSLQSQRGLCPPLYRASALLTGSEFPLSNSLLWLVALQKGQCWASLVTEYSPSMAPAPGAPYVVCSGQIWFPL